VSEGQSIFFWKKKNKNIGEFSEKKKKSQNILNFIFLILKNRQIFSYHKIGGKKKPPWCEGEILQV